VTRVISLDAAGNVQSVESEAALRTRERLRTLAWLLDSSIPLPGTSFSIGLEALIGLVPLLGDLLGVLFSSYILAEAARLGAPKAVLGRMAFNVAVEGIVGIVPFAGDVFDAAWKANQRNVRLLDAWIDGPEKTERSSRRFGALVVCGAAAFLALVGAAGFLLARWLFSLF
jgi:hypothetical protein